MRAEWRPGPASVFALAFGFILCALASPAQAHAILVSSDPPQGAVLDTAPRRVVLHFNEPVAADFAPLVVRDAAGNRVDAGNARISPGDPGTVTVDLRPVGAGLYTVAYRVTSLDGHLVEGTLAFSVGPRGPAPPEPAGAPARVPLAVSLVHGLAQLLAALLAGGVIFRQLVWGGPVTAEWLSAARRWGAGLVLALVAAAAADLAMYAVRGSGQALSPGLFAYTVAATRSGHVWLARLAAAALTGAILASGLRPQGAAGRFLTALPGAALLLTFSLESHAAATGRVLPVAADLVHLLAAATWAGGLLGFAVLVWPSLRRAPGEAREACLAEAVPRFSAAAVAAVLLVVITGVYRSLPHFPSWSALVATGYGQALLAKLGLLVPLLALGGYNLLHRGRGRFRLAVLLELVLIAGIFVAAGRLSTLPPAATELALRSGPFQEEAEAGGLRLRLRIEPNRVGTNRPTVTLSRSDGSPEGGAAVSLRATMAGHDMGVQTLETRERAPGVYEAEPVVFGMDGEWQVEVSVLTAGGREIRTAFRVMVPPPAAVPPPSAVPPPAAG